jgi:uncharacterized membrane protein
VVTTYTVLKTIHVLAAATWVGGGAMVTMLSSRARRESGERLFALTRTIEPIAKVVFPVSGLILVITGFWMIGNGDLDYDTWIVLGIIAWAYSFVAGAALIGPTVGKINEALAEGVTTPRAQPLIERYLLLARIDSLVLALVIIDMVLKPGT